MENEMKQGLTELRSLFFHCLELGGEKIRFNRSMREFLVCFNNWLGVNAVEYYSYYELHGQLIPMFSSRSMEGWTKKTIICGSREQQLLGGSDCFVCDGWEGLEGVSYALPLRLDERVIGMFAIYDLPSSRMPLEKELAQAVSAECAGFIQMVDKISKVAIQEERYKQLFRVTEKFHSSMNINDVLGEIIATLREVYPDFTYYLLLSHDNHHNEDLPIKDLEYNSENIAAMQAYVNGTVQFEDSEKHRKSILYAPLKGKQGVYGVLQVLSLERVMFLKGDIEFITLLANTAGGAIENAQLYQQSKRLIADLQLINETSHRLNSNLRLTEIMNYMREQISKSFNAEEIGFVLYVDEDECQVIPGSTDFFMKEVSDKYVKYIKEKIEFEKESLFLGDMRLQDGNPSEYRSIMAVPMVQSESVKGFAVVMHHENYHFTFEMFKLFQSLIHHSTLAFTNSILREELERMVVVDHVTQLYSRNYLDDRVSESMAKDAEGVFVIMDIDSFKTINDTYGHQIGDEILIQVSNIIMNSIRSTDIGARWGGEELVVYLPGVNLETGAKITERIRQRVERETTPSVTISCGVSHWHSGCEDQVHSLFKRADTALYVAKETGKNRVLLQAENKEGD
ncbi:diguanylate cyclase domain-containing protein [Bacillus sp. 1P06AnD]|uniref:diguanylate cyclase domain-containing protein n=1 Tax=Bacillus sp. 1P06AnD TaxID=3132208 RepID=UPI0039A17DCA